MAVESSDDDSKPRCSERLPVVVQVVRLCFMDLVVWGTLYSSSTGFLERTLRGTITILVFRHGWLKIEAVCGFQCKA